MKKIIKIILLIAILLCVVVSATSCQPPVKTFKWRMATSWNADNLFYTKAAQAICDKVNKLSGGHLIIEASPASKAIGAMEVMDAVSQGKVEMGHSWSGYWLGEDPSFELFSSIPNQMTAQEWGVWLYGPSKGIELWREQYKPYHIIPFPGGLVGPEFGFFTKKPVRTLEDFRGLKLRVSGLAGDVMKELGATTVLTAAGDIKNAMKNGEIDGFEFSTPAVDWPMGFQEVASYVSLPSWHQPSAMFETIVNEDAYAKLPDDLKFILESACKEVAMIDFYTALEGENAAYLSKFEQYGTQINTLSAGEVQKISDITNRLADERATKNAFYSKVLASQRNFVLEYRKWETWGDYNRYAQDDAVDKALSKVRQQLNQEFDSLKQEMESVARKLSGLNLSGPEARNLLNGLMKDRAYVIDVSTVSRNGKLLAVEPEAFHSFEGQDISYQEQVIRLFRTSQPVLSQNFKAVEGFDAADFEYPVFNSNQDIIGSISVLFKPEILLEDAIYSTNKNTSFNIWAMQPDGRLIYDIDRAEIGKNTFMDPVYQSFPQVLALGKEIATNPRGSGRYQFLDTGLKQNVNKECRWITFEQYGTQWRLVLSQVIP